MSLLNILHYPDPKLRIKATPITQVDDPIKKLVDDMWETMYDAPGVGLAAPQVSVSKRLIVIDISEDKSDPLCFINPELIEKHDISVMEEGCLSVPGIYENIERASNITVKALDREGKPFTMDAEGLLSICIQHEIDHLDGKLFVDYLTKMKQTRIRKKMEKLRRHTM